MFQLNSKDETLNILTTYFKKFDSNELPYYLNINSSETIPNFLQLNIYDPEEIELINLLYEHLKIVTSKVFYLTTPFNLKRFPIKLSFITNSIYWEEIFVIEDTIFITYSYLMRIFEKIEYNEYTTVNDVYIKNNNIYDLELLKKLCESVYYIIQFLNFGIWEEYISEKNQCSFVDKSLINFKNKYTVLKEPNTSFINDKITVYWLDSGENYAVFNSICSNLSFSPYWETKVVKLKYANGQYHEILDDTNNDLNNVFKSDSQTNPFVFKTKQMTDCIMHNK